MKRKIFSILFALVLVCSFSLVTAVPAGAAGATFVLNSITFNSNYGPDQGYVAYIQPYDAENVFHSPPGQAIEQYGNPGDLPLGPWSQGAWFNFAYGKPFGGGETQNWAAQNYVVTYWWDRSVGDYVPINGPGGDIYIYQPAEGKRPMGILYQGVWRMFDAGTNGLSDVNGADFWWDLSDAGVAEGDTIEALAWWSNALGFPGLEIEKKLADGSKVYPPYPDALDMDGDGSTEPLTFVGGGTPMSYHDPFHMGIENAAMIPPTEVWVDDDYFFGGDNDGHIWGLDAFATIQDGIDIVAGSIVNVAPGTYNENVHIGKRLTLQGAGSGDNPANDTIVSPPAGQNGIDVCFPVGSPTEPTLVIQHLRVAAEAYKDGIQITDSGGDTNQGNIALTNVVCIGDGISYAMGVDINLNPAASAEDIVMTDCIFSNFAQFGVKVNHHGGSISVTITGGEMSGNRAGIQALCALDGFAGVDFSRDISISGVTFRDNEVGVDFGADDDHCFNDGVVTLQNLIIEDNIIGMRFKGSGSATTYLPPGGYVMSAAPSISVLYCAITGNDTGVVIQNYSNLDNMGLHYNNFCGNTVGLDNQCADTVDATNNFWCDPSGPKHNPGYGDPVSGDVLFNPWLLGPFVPGDPLPATFDKTLALNKGWTLVSTDNWIDPANTVGIGVIAAYKYTPGTPGGYTSVDPTALVPVDALYLKTEVGGALGIKYLGGVPVASSKDLEAGWNLISSATLTDAKAVLSPLRYIDVGDEQGVGLTTLVSQGPFNQHTGSFYLSTFGIFDWGVLGGTMLNPFDGYWIYMNDGKVFGVVPGH